MINECKRTKFTRFSFFEPRMPPASSEELTHLALYLFLTLSTLGLVFYCYFAIRQYNSVETEIKQTQELIDIVNKIKEQTLALPSKEPLPEAKKIK